jgi:hypothetical protein
MAVNADHRLYGKGTTGTGPHFAYSKSIRRVHICHYSSVPVYSSKYLFLLPKEQIIRGFGDEHLNMHVTITYKQM